MGLALTEELDPLDPDAETACRSHPDPDSLWFAKEADVQYQAAKLCRGCPIQRGCLIEGMPIPHGVWGGLTERQRSAIRKKLGMSPPPRGSVVSRNAVARWRELVRRAEQRATN